jgi:hypothetical protein
MAHRACSHAPPTAASMAASPEEIPDAAEAEDAENADRAGGPAKPEEFVGGGADASGARAERSAWRVS